MKIRKIFLKITAFMLTLLFAIALAGCIFPLPSRGTQVALSQSELTLGVGETAQLSAEVSDGSDVLWASQSERIATVSDGLVTGMSEGKTTITAVAGSGYASCTVTVRAAKEEGGIFLSTTSARLKLGEQLALRAVIPQGEEAVWTSEPEGIATVKDGTVTGISAGVALITAATQTGSAQCVITVSDEETSVLALAKETGSVRVGEMLSLIPYSAQWEGVTWFSEDPAVATVKEGVVTGMGMGSVVISAWTATASAACRVTVIAPDDPRKEGYELVWSDEFSGDTLDLAKWSYMTGVQDVYGSSQGPMFWGNNELQYYTEDAVSLRGGSLIITATRQEMDYGRQFTSARIHTRDKGHWTYGYFEARMQTPAKTGMWPAFWMLPQPSSAQSSQNVYGGWPANGEIDIMEARGRLQNRVDTTAHFGAYGRQASSGTTSAVKGTMEDWHTYALEWTQYDMTWYIDGYPVHRVGSSEWWSGSSDRESAPFDVDFYILINLAVGGNYDQNYAPAADFVSAEMRVDYVRVYQAVQAGKAE